MDTFFRDEETNHLNSLHSQRPFRINSTLLPGGCINCPLVLALMKLSKQNK